MCVADASVSCSGAEQKEEEEKDGEKKEEEKKESCSDGSPRPGEVVVAVAVCTPPLIVLQYSITYIMLLDRSI